MILRQPDDWHLHLRDGAMLEAVVSYTARQFARAIIMPNLVPPVTTVAAARAYRERIQAAVPPELRFTPLMTAYLTDDIAPDELAEGFEQGVFTAAKLYPANATTNSALGVTDVRNIYQALERMQRIGMPLLVHGEVTADHVDIFDREAVFIDSVLAPLLKDLPELKVVFEHITTRQAVAFVESAQANVAATITAHHLMINRNALLVGGMRPHLYCLPIAKREEHRLALRRAATSGNPRFFLGTDSAPHGIEDKESACGCAGIFSAPVALECYAMVFEEEGALPRLQAFAAEHGPDFYGLPRNTTRVRLRREPQTVVPELAAAQTRIVPFLAGQTIGWRYDSLASAVAS
ncbi:MAG: dihydroorotase [Pseudomonadota bacterium]